ncbi:guanyl-nucleotide exchange factor [Trichosporon asahii var. asahii CBS 8904]|uniref:Guanyl-nucleotide exchange factor n=2 Tax=Trichosporon asahii var. asahii TaxID=189963 RepID=K1W0V9_TRIAC|nr:guanyl-nucleotide exchange factor [Trichosporon asahii var. asahii CBS 2479]EJT51854.1 guanyl-nucleotide exchange factor [Trichosporon asahii var. asahii CBS 2479]EKD02618.1 guanyl-nucleotide exchange factor [Trichosporon asahii var. asahii CBS 8904]
MSEQKGLFSTLSLGRTRSGGVNRVTSEPIAHPLLGTDDTKDKDLKDEPAAAADGSLPYKPRQRNSQWPNAAPSPTLQPSPATTTAAPAPSFAGEADTAAGKLQLQSLKAAAQRLGLKNGSMGMGMIEAIYDKGTRARDAGDWAELLKVLTSNKAVLLLPETAASSLPMTPQTLRDHIGFIAPPSGDGAVVITLSGLIGTLRGTVLSFESTAPGSPLLAALRDDEKRTAMLSTFRPTETSEALEFPGFTVSSEPSSLPFPPLGKQHQSERRDVPGRRMGFMSLFGSSGSGTPMQGRSLSPERATSPTPPSRVPSPRPSVMSLEDDSEGYSVTAYMVDKPVRYAEVHKHLVKAVRSTVKKGLEGLPDRVADKVVKLVMSSICPIAGSTVDQALLKSHHRGYSDADGAIPLDFSDPALCGERLQDFMEAIYDDLIKHYRPRRSVDTTRSGRSLDEEEDDTEASAGTERVEALVCSMLYNRIFSPLSSDDANHDEALASRIAGLNMAELTLDHLGLITRPPGDDGKLAAGLDGIVEQVGAELQKLNAPHCLKPKDKVDVLVAAHKLVVDGLAKLPPVKLRPEGEPYQPPGPGETAELSEIKADTKPEPASVDLNADEDASEDRGETSKDATPMSEETSEAQQETRPEDDTGTTASGADLILPLIIYSVVKSNPAHLASQLMYVRRYRSSILLRGDQSYAIVNLTAVVEFLEHVSLAELGLGSYSSRVLSVADLTPIGLGEMDPDVASASTRLKSRVFAVGELAVGSANKVLSGIADSGWSAMRGFMSPDHLAPPGAGAQPQSPTSPTQPGRPRGASTFSLASVTASVANIAAAASTAAARTRSQAGAEEDLVGGKELVDVPASSRPETPAQVYGSPVEEGENLLGASLGRSRSHSDARSTRSTRSDTRPGPASRTDSKSELKSSTGPKEKGQKGEKSRFASFGRLSSSENLAEAKDKGGFFSALTARQARRPSIMTSLDEGAPASEGEDFEPPVERWMVCDPGELRVGEVAALLRDYRRLAGVVAKLQRERERE